MIDGQTRIADVYAENKFNLFLKYCEENGLKVMDDLKGYDFANLQGVDHIGVGKINDIRSRCKAFFGEEALTSFSESCDIEAFHEINEDIADCDIDFLCTFDIKKRAVQSLRKNGCRTVGDLKDVSKATLKKLLTVGSYKNLIAAEEYLSKPLGQLLESRLQGLSEEPGYMITVLRAEGYTLQAIGDSYHVTRERIRQIVNKFEKRIEPIMSAFTTMNLRKKGYISGSDIIDYYEDEKKNMILFLWLKDCENLEYLDFADIFVPYYKVKGYHRKRILDIAVEFIGDGIDLSDHLDDLEILMFKNGYPYVDEAAFLNLVQSERYYVYGDYVVKGRQSYALLCSRIVEKRFPNGVKLYKGSEDLALLRQLARRTYGEIGVSDDDRAFSARLSDFLILCDKGKVTAKENIMVDMSVIRKIKTYIDQSNEKEVYYSALFDMFKNELTASGNIDNYYFLHGVLKMYYEDEYDFSSRDYLVKSGKGLSSGRTDDKILKIIESDGAPVGKLVLKKKVPGLSDAMLINATMYNEKLIAWEPNYYYSMSCIDVSDEEKSFLRLTIENIMAQYRGYCSGTMLFHEVNTKRPQFLKKNMMNEPDNLYYVCAKLFSNLFGFRKPHITRLGLLEEISAKNVVLHLMRNPSEFTYNNYKDIAKKLMWTDVTMNSVLASIESDYIRVSEDKYVKRDAISISNLDVERITFSLRQSLQKGFLPLSGFDKWNLLPHISLEWNPFLLRYIVENNVPEFKIIDVRKKYRTHESGIIVSSESKLVDYTDVVLLVLADNNRTEIEENELCSLLMQEGLVYRFIPQEVYASDKIKYKEGLFTVKERKA